MSGQAGAQMPTFTGEKKKKSDEEGESASRHDLAHLLLFEGYIPGEVEDGKPVETCLHRPFTRIGIHPSKKEKNRGMKKKEKDRSCACN